jgi:hypothetical protein
MKVYLSPYRNHWISPYTILQRVCFWRVVPRDDDDESISDDPVLEKWADRLTPFCEKLRSFLDWIHPPVTYVKIDYHDTWSMDHTLAHIIVPMLKQLQATKQGSAQVDAKDVPKRLKPTEPAGPNNGYTDNTIHERWQWVLDEMIWAFEQKLKDDAESQFYDHSGVNNSASLNTQIGQIKVDRAGLDAYNKRMANGFRLFGKYYQGLWD